MYIIILYLKLCLRFNNIGLKVMPLTFYKASYIADPKEAYKVNTWTSLIGDKYIAFFTKAI